MPVDHPVPGTSRFQQISMSKNMLFQKSQNFEEQRAECSETNRHAEVDMPNFIENPDFNENLLVLLNFINKIM